MKSIVRILSSGSTLLLLTPLLAAQSVFNIERLARIPAVSG